MPLMDPTRMKSHQKDFLLYAPFLIADSAFLLRCAMREYASGSFLFGTI